jgi:hypothetical protein
MRQTIKTVAHAPMKLAEPLLIGTLVMLLVGFNIAAGSRSTDHLPALGLSLFQSSVAAPTHHKVSSIDE